MLCSTYPCTSLIPQVESLQELLGISRTESNRANKALEGIKAERDGLAAANEDLKKSLSTATSQVGITRTVPAEGP